MFQLSICAGTILQGLPFLERVRAIARAGFAVDFWSWEDDALDEIAADPDITIGAMPGWRQGSMVHPDGVETFFEGVRCTLRLPADSVVETWRLPPERSVPRGRPFMRSRSIRRRCGSRPINVAADWLSWPSNMT